MRLPVEETDDAPAGIQYMGIAGATRQCVDAVRQLIQCRERITQARLLTCAGGHAFLLTVDPGDVIAIKSGFASGYGGTAPAGLSYVLQLLDSSDVELVETEVSEEWMQRLDASALTLGDMNHLVSLPSNHNLYGYIQQRHDEWASTGRLWQSFGPVMPFAIIDRRIMDLARAFWDDPDKALLTGYRRLEDFVRARIPGEAQHTRLMSQAFMGRDSALTWECDEGEQVARANLFVGAFGAFRNPRAHRERHEDVDDQLAEFLMLNQLFRLETTAIERATLPPRERKTVERANGETT
jgi:hypothetical protein